MEFKKMPDPKRPTFTLENAQVIYPNLEGRVSEYNKEGKKGFAIVLPEDFADKLLRDGWHVNRTEPREEGEPSIPFINIKVNFKQKPPRVVMVTSTGPVPLNERSVGVLDDADIEYVDLTCIGNPWERGLSCYLQKAFFVINEDVLDQKYGFSYLNQEGDED